MEHHANFVPWQILCQATGCELRVIPVTSRGDLDLDQAKEMIDSHTVLMALVHISNSMGTVNPIEGLIKHARSVGAYSLIDGAQSVSHLPIDVEKLGCDFFVFSGHKLFCPYGNWSPLWTERDIGKHASVPVWRRYDTGGEYRANIIQYPSL